MMGQRLRFSGKWGCFAGKGGFLLRAGGGRRGSLVRRTGLFLFVAGVGNRGGPPRPACSAFGCAALQVPDTANNLLAS
jgi:hypothetical protein